MSYPESVPNSHSQFIFHNVCFSHHHRPYELVIFEFGIQNSESWIFRIIVANTNAPKYTREIDKTPILCVLQWNSYHIGRIAPNWTEKNKKNIIQFSNQLERKATDTIRIVFFFFLNWADYLADWVASGVRSFNIWMSIGNQVNQILTQLKH